MENKKENKEKIFPNIEFLISDWDGTLVDSMPDYTESFVSLMSSKFNIPKEESKTFYLERAGQPLRNQIAECAKKFANQNVEDTLPLEQKFWDNLIDIKPPMLEGAREFLEDVKSKGIRIVVWSGTRTDILRKNIKLLGLSPLVDFAIGNEPGSKEMVKGPGLLKVVSGNFQTDPSEFAKKSLVIGDGIGDVEAGKAIGARTAGFTKVKKPSLLASNPDFFFDNYSELLQTLKK